MLCPLPSPRRHSASPLCSNSPLPYPRLNLLKHICELTGLFLITPGQFLLVTSVQSTIEVHRMNPRPRLPADTSCFDCVLPDDCASPCLSWVTCTSSPGRALCPLDSWRADVMAAGINSTKGLRKQGELESPCASQSGFGSVNSQNHRVNKSKKC